MRTVHRNLARFLLVAAAIALILGPARPAFSGWLDGVKEMKIGEQTLPICPEEYLAKTGLPIREVPDDQNAAIEYVKAINLYVKRPDELDDLYQYVMRNVWIDEADKVIPWLEKNAGAIAAVREGAKKADSKFPFFGGPGVSLYELLLPHLGRMRELARLVVVQGKYLEHQKKYRQALDTYLVAAKLGYHVSREPFLISGLVGIACDSIAAKRIESCILRNRLDTDTLTYLLDRLHVVGTAAENYQIAMAAEKAGNLWAVDEFFDRPARFRMMFEGSGGGGAKLKEVLSGGLGKSPGLRAIMKSDIRRYWNRMDKWNDLPDHIALRPENIPHEKIIEELPPWSLAKMLAPALSHARVSFVRLKAMKAILTAEIALQIYRNENNSYPRNLEQLKGILSKTPIDPFTNEPLKYRRTENGYVVYSVNENLVDDGGEGDLARGRKDIVGRYPLPEPEPFK